MYRSAGYIDEFYRRMTEAAGQLTQDFELIFVNDGSPDPSLEKAKTYAHDPRVVVARSSLWTWT
jgi:putative glycosyltransferase